MSLALTLQGNPSAPLCPPPDSICRPLLPSLACQAVGHSSSVSGQVSLVIKCVLKDSPEAETMADAFAQMHESCQVSTAPQSICLSSRRSRRLHGN